MTNIRAVGLLFSSLFLAAAIGCGERTLPVLGASPSAPTDAAGSPPASCLEQLGRAPRSPDGTYAIDPDGSGGRAPLSVLCEMIGGGWTRIVDENFAAVSPLFPETPVATCGDFGAILGRFGPFADRPTEILVDLDLKGVPHEQVRVRFQFVVIDSWDEETAYLDLDGVRVWSLFCTSRDPTLCGQRSNHCAGAESNKADGRVPVDVTIAHSRNALTFSLRADLDQADESWGISDLIVSVR